MTLIRAGKLLHRCFHIICSGNEKCLNKKRKYMLTIINKADILVNVFRNNLLKNKKSVDSTLKTCYYRKVAVERWLIFEN